MIREGKARIPCAGDGEAVIAEFIRTRGITRCPTACVLPTQGSVDAADRARSKSMPLPRNGCARPGLLRDRDNFGLQRSPRPGTNRR